MKKIGGIILFFLFALHPLESKVHIFSYGLNSYFVFARAQTFAFKKYLKDDFTYYLVLDEMQSNVKTLQQRAAKHKYSCILVPGKIANESSFFRKNKSLNGNLPKILAYIYEKVLIKPGDVLVWMPYNMFIVKDFSFQQRMKSIDLMGGIAQHSFFDNMKMINSDYFVVKENALRQQFSIGFEQLFLEGKMIEIGNKYYYQIPLQSQLRFCLIDKSSTTKDNFSLSPFSKLLSTCPNKIQYLLNSTFIQYNADWSRNNPAESLALHIAISQLK